MSHNKLKGSIFFYFSATLIAIFMLLPFFWMISTSLKSSGSVMTIPIQWIPENPGFNSYRKVFEIFPFARSIFNSVFVAVATTLITVLSSAMAAYVFAKFEFKGREILFSLYLATLMIPKQVTMIPNFLIIREIGLLNTFTGLMLPSLFNAFATFMLRQNIKTVPDSYIEAAVMEGSSQFRIFKDIILPLVKPTLATLTVITFMEAWNRYLWPLIVLTDRSKMTLPVGLSLLNGQYGEQYNLLMAGSLISIIPMLLVYIFAQKYFEKGLSVGGIKG
ncbi:MULTISPECIES: carbohydrate ABC transporter permease [Halanaerobium]|uniref:Carbohydrate ABC transporter membrane protein 2, CUT1 family n=1 Tax=Halanaerobium kushneri TaxID=56779 RepID=A0A1N6ZZ67_9FIRM|nr:MULTISPECIES: carbohydrate ABC transporter permease [Halanaerobium]RCW60373.1 carbohydrate ABC transporter membrane protein 2 (CUT1 family) [Halanaerobium sp. ST460_2HS_T2]SIR32152.1 carbohydrate ABC transporter membrane protein 2, CUT1 family [Halanaerobium kushneri]